MHIPVNLLGVNVHAVDMQTTIEDIGASIKAGSPAYICLAPAHNIMAGRADLKLRAVFNQATLSVPDGMGTVWFLRALGHKAGRVYGPDLLFGASKMGQEAGWRHYFLGGTPEVVHHLVERLQKEFSKLQVAGFFSPPFRKMGENETSDMVNRINESQPDIIWIGLGSPKQEFWMAEFRDRLQAPVLVGVGAAFDFISGAKPQAPKWIQRAGLEWFFRLVTEPRRLWRRYAQYPLFVILAAAQILGLSRYEVEPK